MTTYGSLFSGAGGFDLGSDAAGWECKFQVEWERHPTSVLQHHWPDVPKWSDVRDVNGGDIPPVDVITFGFPCQDLSSSGRRVGLDGNRSGLFFEAIRMIKEMREKTNGKFPRIVCAENVRGLLNADDGAAMGRCLDELANIGAVGIEWRLYDTQFFGLPQRRRRVFIVATFDPRTLSQGPVFPDPETNHRDHPKAETIIGFYRTQGKIDYPGIGILPTLKMCASAIVGESIRPRNLTPKESERAQGWPDDHTRWDSNGKEIADGPRYKMIGNGVASPVAKYVCECIERVLQ